MVYFEIGLYMLLQLPFLYLIQKTALKNCSGNKKLRLWKLFIIRAFVPCSIPFTIGITHTLPLSGSTNTTYTGTKEGLYNAAKHRWDFTSVLLGIWIAVALTLLFLYLLLYAKSKQILLQSVPMTEEEIQAIVADNSQAFLPVWADWKVPLSYSDQCTSPVVCGIRKPGIVFSRNAKGLSVSDKRLILLHEYMHIKGHDNLWKFLSGLVVCLYWFNPLVWLVYFKFSQELELCCDERVLHFLHTADARKAYANSILHFAVLRNGFPLFESGFAKNETKERIVAIMTYKKHKKFLFSASAALILCGITLFTAPHIKAQESNDVNTPMTVQNNDETSMQAELPEEELSEEYPSDAADAFETADLNITDANLDGLVELAANGSLSEEKTTAVINAFHERNRRICAEYEKAHTTK